MSVPRLPLRPLLGVAAALLAAATLVGQGGSPPQATRTISWERAREASGKYLPVLDTSGLVEVDSHIPPNTDASDLAALCAGRQRAIELARGRAGDGIRGLGIDDDPMTNTRRALFERNLGSVATYVGDVAASVQHFTKARDALAPWIAEYPDTKPDFLKMQEALGIANLRRAEVENCLVMSSADRCLFPLRPGGMHHKPEGAEQAIEYFTAGLRDNPRSLEQRFLLNLAYMVLGRYPADVPKEYLLAPSLFESEAPMPRFMDVAGPTHLGKDGIAGGTIVEDFDGDGLLDVAFTTVDYCGGMSVYRNNGHGTFDETTAKAGVGGQTGGLNATFTDYNNDGRPDLYVLRGGWEIAMRNSLLRNNGDGTFTDVTRESGLLDPRHSTNSAAWGDYDNDGFLDVFVAHEATPSQLYRNRGDGTFEEIGAKAGVNASAFSKGAAAGDYDKDGWLDIYVSNMFGENYLYHNNRNGTFTEVAAKAGVQKPFVSFPTWFFDYDNDGWLDIFVSSYPPSLEEFVKHYVDEAPSAETLALYRNNGNGTFTDVTKATRLDRVVPTMGSGFGDLDNDGFLDMYLGTGTPSFGSLMPNIMLLNDKGRRFLDVTAATGTGHLQKGHGVAFADLDNDGDEDVVLNNGGAVPGDNFDESLYENPGTPNHWISLRLVGVKSNRSAVGATVTVKLPDASSGSALRYRQVTSGSSFGNNPLTQHIGIGRARRVVSVEVFWPVTGARQVFRDVPIDTFLRITEGDPKLAVLHPPRVTLAGSATQ